MGPKFYLGFLARLRWVFLKTQDGQLYLGNFGFGARFLPARSFSFELNWLVRLYYKSSGMWTGSPTVMLYCAV
jgi:hypothetical protein